MAELSIKNKINFIAILDNIRSRENVGSIFRTADAAGISKLWLCGITPCPPHPKISKSALGAENFLPWQYQKNCWRIIENLKKQGFFIIALEQNKKALNLFKFKPRQKNIALVVGNEITGVSKSALKKADKILEIPMRGKKESLNVAVAFGIAAYQLKRNNIMVIWQ